MSDGHEHHHWAERATRRRVALVLFGALVIAVGVGVLIGRGAGYTDLAERLREADPRWLALCVAGELVAYVGYVAVFRETTRLAGGPRMTRTSTVVTVFASLGATRIVAAAGAGGLAVFYWVLRQVGVEAREAVTRLLALNILLFAVFGVAGSAAALALLLGPGGAPAWLLLLWIALVPTCFTLAAFVSAPARAARLGADEGGRIRRAFATAVRALVLVRGVFGAPREHRWLLGGAVLYWAGDVACLWAGLRAFEIALTPPEVLLAYATGYVANLLPLPFSGVGGVDAAMTYASVAVGVPLEAALLGVFAFRLFSFWLPTLPGLIALSTLPELGRRLHHAAPARPAA